MWTAGAALAGSRRRCAGSSREQRVRVQLDIVTPVADRPGLGDGYRVFVRVVTWSGDAVLQVPQSALFRSGDGWAVFAVAEGRATLRPVEIGHINDTVAEVVSGLAEGDQVVTFPPAALSDGDRIAPRP